MKKVYLNTLTPEAIISRLKKGEVVKHAFEPDLKMKFEYSLVSAEWCGTCRLVHKKLDDNGIVYKTIDADKDNIDDLNIEQIPVMIAYKDGKEISRWDDTCGDILSWITFVETY